MSSTKPLLARIAGSLVLGVGILVLSLAFAAMLISRREPPKQITPPEPVLSVELARMTPEDVPILIVGYGEAASLEVAPITVQVSGNVEYVHERLYVGEIIPEGEVWLRIDPRNYQAALAQAEAQASQARSALGRLREQYASDKERLQTVSRTRDLARNEHDRVKTLFEQQSVGALANVERAEMSYNQARDAFDLLQQAIDLYPARINEAEQAAAAAEAALTLARVNLERTEIKAPFTARIREKRVERGQFVGPNAPVLTLANDAMLEIAVPLDSRDVRDGLQFEAAAPAESDMSWFAAVEQTPCRIYWTEATDAVYWPGRLDRVIAFDQTTRTVTVAVRVSAEEARSPESGIPLVAGMFCRVELQGAVMSGVYRLPRWAVTFENEVYLAEAGRLVPRKVDVARTQHEQSFISGGLNADDLVVITRLVNPLPNAKLRYDEAAIVSSAALSETMAEPVQEESGT